MLRIKEGIEALPPSIRVQHKDKVGELQLDERGVLIEIEVKMVVRGLLDEANKAPPCETAQAQFDAFYRNSKSQSERDDQAFLLSLNRLPPNGSIYDYQDFASVKWQRLNLEKFKKDNPEAYQQQLSGLESILQR